MSKLTSLGIVGKKKGVDELRFEEVWMKRIEILEAQYDQHVSQIQRRVLDEKFNKRLLLSLRSENLKLKKSSQELATHSDALQLKLQNLQIELHRKDASVSWQFLFTLPKYFLRPERFRERSWKRS